MDASWEFHWRRNVILLRLRLQHNGSTGSTALADNPLAPDGAKGALRAQLICRGAACRARAPRTPCDGGANNARLKSRLGKIRANNRALRSATPRAGYATPGSPTAAAPTAHAPAVPAIPWCRAHSSSSPSAPASASETHNLSRRRHSPACCAAQVACGGRSHDASNTPVTTCSNHDNVFGKVHGSHILRDRVRLTRRRFPPAGGGVVTDSTELSDDAKRQRRSRTTDAVRRRRR